MVCAKTTTIRRYNLVDMSEHTRRVVVGFALLVILIPAVIWLSTMTVTVIFGSLCVLAVYEWTKLIITEDNRNKQRLGYLLVCILSSLVLASLSIRYDNKLILYVALLWWFAALVLSTFYTTALCSKIAFKWFLSVHIIVALTACAVAIYLLHEMAWFWLLYAIALVALCDISAYYVGRRIGKSKLAPAISRGKTKEGLWAALFAALLLSLLSSAGVLENVTVLSVVSLVLLSLIACIAGVVGDLTESMAKRCAGVKDSGNLLPGHGGLLDRIDAFIAVAPVIALGVLYY